LLWRLPSFPPSRLFLTSGLSHCQGHRSFRTCLSVISLVSLFSLAVSPATQGLQSLCLALLGCPPATGTHIRLCKAASLFYLPRPSEGTAPPYFFETESRVPPIASLDLLYLLLGVFLSLLNPFQILPLRSTVTLLVRPVLVTPLARPFFRQSSFRPPFWATLFLELVWCCTPPVPPGTTVPPPLAAQTRFPYRSHFKSEPTAW